MTCTAWRALCSSQVLAAYVEEGWVAGGGGARLQ